MFGNDDQWAIRTFDDTTSSITCDRAAFGIDPLDSTVKACLHFD